MEQIKYNLVQGGKHPAKGSEGAAAFDLFSRGAKWNEEAGYLEVMLGVKFEIPQGWVGKLYPRSSVSNNGLHMANSVGVIDSDFRGEVRARFYASPLHVITKFENKEKFINFINNEVYGPGKACAQIIFEKLPEVTLVPVTEEELSVTDRGEGGYGSTDKK